MPRDTKIYPDALEWIQQKTAGLPKEWPPELPPESQSESEEFWREACRHEMSTRDKLSAKILGLVDGSESAPMTPLESWLFWRRIEWGGQMILARAMKEVAPAESISMSDILQWALVDTWETNGCIAMWIHSERGGKPHPENPDGLSPLP